MLKICALAGEKMQMDAVFYGMTYLSFFIILKHLQMFYPHVLEILEEQCTTCKYKY